MESLDIEYIKRLDLENPNGVENFLGQTRRTSALNKHSKPNIGSQTDLTSSQLSAIKASERLSYIDELQTAYDLYKSGLNTREIAELLIPKECNRSIDVAQSAARLAIVQQANELGEDEIRSEIAKKNSTRGNLEFLKIANKDKGFTSRRAERGNSGENGARKIQRMLEAKGVEIMTDEEFDLLVKLYDDPNFRHKGTYSMRNGKPNYELIANTFNIMGNHPKRSKRTIVNIFSQSAKPNQKERLEQARKRKLENSQ